MAFLPNGRPAPKAPPPEPPAPTPSVADAQANFDRANVFLADAEAIAQEKLTARLAKESEEATARQQAVTLWQKAYVDRGNDELLTELGKAEKRVEFVAKDHLEAIAAHEEAQKRVADTKAVVAKAATQLEIAQLKADSAGRNRVHAMTALASGLVDDAKAFEAKLGRIHALQTEENKIVDRLRELGDNSISRLDGTAAMGAIFKRSLETGGRIHTSPYEIRFPLDADNPPSSPLYNRTVAALKTFEHILVADVAGQRTRGKDSENYKVGDMAKAGEVFSKSRNRVEGLENFEAFDRAEVDAKNAKDRAAHDGRLTKAANAGRRQPPPPVPQIPSSLIPKTHWGSAPGEGHGMQFDGNPIPPWERGPNNGSHAAPDEDLVEFDVPGSSDGLVITPPPNAPPPPPVNSLAPQAPPAKAKPRPAGLDVAAPAAMPVAASAPQVRPVTTRKAPRPADGSGEPLEFTPAGSVDGLCLDPSGVNGGPRVG